MDRPGDWLNEQRSELAAERILDAAARVFAERGVAATGMGDVAREAGCSRATLYRYFENRHALRIAYIHRESRRIGHEVVDAVAGIGDTGERVVRAVLEALRRVRQDPTLAAWFSAADSGIGTSLAHSSPVIEAMIAAFLGDPADADVVRRARWLNRVVVSLLAVPGGDENDERDMLERFVVPVVLDTAGRIQ